MVKQDSLEETLILETQDNQVLYKRQSPTKAVLTLATKKHTTPNRSITLNFGELLAPDGDYVKSFILGVLNHEKGHIFHFDDVECIPHHECPFCFFPANIEYLLEIVYGCVLLGLFCWEVECLSFSMAKRYRECFR